MSIYRWLASIILGVFIILPTIVLALLGTEVGSRWVIEKSIHYVPVDISYEQFQGKLLSNFSFKRLNVESESFAYKTKELKVHWQPLTLLSGSITVENIAGQQSEIRLRRSDASSSDDVRPVSVEDIQIELPLAIDIKKLTLSDSLFFLFDAPAQMLDVTLSIKAHTNGVVSLRNFSATHQYMTASISGQSSLSYPFKSSLTSQIRLHSPDYPKLTVDSKFKGNIEKIVANNHFTESISGSVEATVLEPLEDLTWSFSSQWSDNDLTPWLNALGSGNISLAFNGAIAGEGDVKRALVSPDLSVVVNQQPVKVAGEVSYQADAIKLHALKISSDSDINGDLFVNGDISQLTSEPSFQLTTQWSEFFYKPNNLLAKNGEVEIKGSLNNLSIRLSSHLSGVLQTPLNLNAKATLSQSQLHVTELEVSQDRNTLLAETTIKWADDISLAANISGLYKGNEVTSDISMRYADPYLFINKLEGRWGEQSFTVNGALSPGQALYWEVRSNRLDDISTLRGAALASGTIEGQLNQPNFTMHLDTFELNHPNYSKVFLTEPTQVSLNYENMSFSLMPTCLGYKGLKSPLCVELEKTKNLLSFDANAQSVPLNVIQALIAPSAPYNLAGKLTLNVDGKVDTNTAELSQLNASINADNSTVGVADETVTLDTLSLNAETKEQRLAVYLKAAAKQQGLNLDGTLRTDNLSLNSSLSGTVVLRSETLELANLLTPQLDIGDGQASANLRISGTIPSPLASGDIQLNANQVVVLKSGTMISDLTAALNANANSGEFEVNAAGLIGDGNFNIDGKLNLFKRRGELEINGDELLIVDTSDILIEASPKIQISIDKNLVSLSGNLNIPKARITPVELNQAETESADVRLKNEEKKASTFKTQTDLRVSLGEDVRVKALGFSGQLEGGLRITQQPNSPAKGAGTIGVTTGQYEIYGQKLTVERGDLLFNDVPLSNPSLNLRVTRDISSTAGEQRPPDEIGARVTGSIEQPELGLFSTPPLPDSTILSYLLFGKPPGSQGDVDNLELQAALLVGGRSTKFLTEGLKETFDLDEVSIDSQTSDVNDTSLYIGKHLSPDLYIKYGIGLIEPTSTFILRYSLSDQLIFESISTSEGQGGDLIYTIEN